jgi:hypothetical protein
MMILSLRNSETTSVPEMLHAPKIVSQSLLMLLSQMMVKKENPKVQASQNFVG